MAYLCASMVNLAIGIHGKNGARMKPITDFLLQWDIEGIPEKRQSPDDILKIFQGIAGDQKAAAERKKKIAERKEKREKEIREKKDKDKINQFKLRSHEYRSNVRDVRSKPIGT